MSKFSRRDFLKSATIMSGIGAVVTNDGSRYLLEKYRFSELELQSDVLVVGAGLAGLTSAMVAADTGAKVFLLEKTDNLGGTGQIAGGSISAANAKMQIEKGIEDSPELHYQDCQAIGKGTADPDILRLYTENAGETVDWLQDLGVEFRSSGPRFAPEHELYSVPRTYDAVSGAKGFLKVLIPEIYERVKKGRIAVFMKIRVNDLIKENGRVVGVKATNQFGSSRSLYSKTVILASGGFGSNWDMIEKYSPKYTELVTICQTSSMGDGIRIAENIGAKLVRMHKQQPYFAGMENPLLPKRTSFYLLLSGMVPWKGEIWVDKTGKRFFNEDDPSPDNREEALKKIPDSVCYIIFNQEILEQNERAPFLFFRLLASKDILAKTGNTVEELASKIAVNAQTLKDTINTYNGFVEAGEDAAFGRTDLIKMDKGPFYAIKASGVVFVTMGGVKTNVNFQVLDHNDQVIPGIYAVGEVQGFGTWSGDGFCSGMGNGPCFVFGRITAKNAAAESAAS